MGRRTRPRRQLPEGWGNVLMQQARMRHNWSQADLAERVGLVPGAIGAYERGESSPSLEVALKLAEIIGTTVESLFSDAAFGEMSKEPKPRAIGRKGAVSIAEVERMIADAIERHTFLMHGASFGKGAG